MGLAYRWNREFDAVPEARRMHVMMGIVVLSGAINMTLTIATGFPFALLILLTIFVLAAWRLPYRWGFLTAPGEIPDPKRLEGAIDADWLYAWNQWYDAIPEPRRFYVVPAILVIVGGFNMMMTIGDGFPFGLLFLLAVLAMVAIRAPYARGWVRVPPPVPAKTEPQLLLTEEHGLPTPVTTAMTAPEPISRDELAP